MHCKLCSVYCKLAELPWVCPMTCMSLTLPKPSKQGTAMELPLHMLPLCYHPLIVVIMSLIGSLP